MTTSSAAGYRLTCTRSRRARRDRTSARLGTRPNTLPRVAWPIAAVGIALFAVTLLDIAIVLAGLA